MVSELRDITEKLFTWFSQNEMKASLGKCHMFLSSTESLKSLKFEKHINTICQKANRKLNALARITPYMELTKRRILMNAFFDSHECFNKPATYRKWKLPLTISWKLSQNISWKPL